jgi:hypothetical protein
MISVRILMESSVIVIIVALVWQIGLGIHRWTLALETTVQPQISQYRMSSSLLVMLNFLIV